MEKMPLVIVITGPTGVGKTDISLDIANHFHGEIINCDASQFKKELNIGTAKIDIQKTKIIHHLIDITNPDENYSIASFQREARKLIGEINARGRTPLLVGGSGLYISACIYDYNLSSSKRGNDVVYESYNNDQLHDLLKEVDYMASKVIHKNNRLRVIRAIEVALDVNGKKMSDNICQMRPVFNYVGICLTTQRDILYKRINERVDQMISAGFIDECQKLMNSNYNLNKITDIGYQDIFSYLRKEKTLPEVCEIIKQSTRRYAKRQMTWFRNKMRLDFVEINYDNLQTTKREIIGLIEKKSKQVQ